MLRPKPISISDALRKVVAAGDPGRLEKALAIMHPADLAVIVPDLKPEQRRNVVEVLLRLRKAGQTLREISHPQLADILSDLDDHTVIDVVKRLPPDDAVDLIQGLPDERRLRVLNGLRIGEATELRTLMAYSPETAGGIMTTEFFALQETDTAAQAIAAIRGHRHDPGLFYMYVVDAEGRLKGILTLLQLVAAEGEAKIREFMIEEVYTAQPAMTQEDAARMFARYNLVALPVVDEHGIMLGVITVDDVVDVINEEATEDIYLMAGLSQDDRVFTSWTRSVRLRLPWLVINLATATLVAKVVSFFEPALEAVALLAVFMPMVAGMGGNAGTQTITVMVRGLALDELHPGHVRSVVMKEVLVGLFNGLFTGLLAAGVAYLWKANLVLGLVLFLAMVLNSLVAALAGTLIPLSLKALRLDPAIASSIFVTTLTDVFGFLSFLGLATLLLAYMT